VNKGLQVTWPNLEEAQKTGQNTEA